jgi:hypothetical protein
VDARAELGLVERGRQAIVGPGVEGGDAKLRHISGHDRDERDVRVLDVQLPQRRRCARADKCDVGTEYRDEPARPKLVVHCEDIVAMSSQKPRQLWLVRRVHKQDSEFG